MLRVEYNTAPQYTAKVATLIFEYTQEQRLRNIQQLEQVLRDLSGTGGPMTGYLDIVRAESGAGENVFKNTVGLLNIYGMYGYQTNLIQNDIFTSSLTDTFGGDIVSQFKDRFNNKQGKVSFNGNFGEY